MLILPGSRGLEEGRHDDTPYSRSNTCAAVPISSAS
jgi:hypothetical protein